MSNPRLKTKEYTDGILKGDRIMLAKAITLVESQRPDDQKISSELIASLLPHTGQSIRVGITGVPGVGKSTFIEAFGTYLTSLGSRVAVLTVDPSSKLTRGSILGDKTRMETLSKNKSAFIRPSPSSDTLGGVTGATRETILLCEAAGFDVILVETVGVGQSEVAVRSLVDFFLLLMLAGAGDELQGIKKGIMEMADALVITKADGDNVREAGKARAEYQQSIHLHNSGADHWSKKVLVCSAFTGEGLPEIWKLIGDYRLRTSASGYFEENRRRQNAAWLQEIFERKIFAGINASKILSDKKMELQQKIARQEISAPEAADLLLAAFYQHLR